MKNSFFESRNITMPKIIGFALLCIIIAIYFFIDINGGKGIYSNSNAEKNNIKRLEAVDNSGNKWGVSPFDRGEPKVGMLRSDFQMPSTEWKTRVIDGVKYVFGEGNPKEVELNSDSYKSTDEKDGIPYVTPAVEAALKSFLEDGRLKTLMDKCLEEIGSSSPEAIYLNSTDLSMERMLYVNESTFRKEIRVDVYESFGLVMIKIINPLGDGVGDIAKSCLSEYDLEMVRGLSEKHAAIGREYFNSQGVSGD